jgi:methyl-accepting chemotaxis protein
MKNIPIIGKFLSILTLFGIFAVGSTIYSTSQMHGIQGSYEGVINSPLKAAEDITLANRYLLGAKNDIAQELIDTDAANNAADAAALTADRNSYNAAISAAEADEPSEAGDISALATRVGTLLDSSCAKAQQMGEAATTPPAILASQQEYLANCSPGFPPIVSDAMTLRKSLSNAADSDMVTISAQTASTIILTLGMVLGGLVAVMLAGFFGIRAWVVSPIKALQGTMGVLAGGNYKIEVAGLERKDEIGGMSRAVQVFKDAGLEKIRLEAEAEAARNAAAADRARAQAESEAAAAEQAAVVESLADGLANLAKGDLVFRLNKEFSAGYEKLRADFNAAVNTLQQTMTAIDSNTQAVRAGAEEITQASDDLARRTEQQAASLEQTAAALDQITATVRKTAEGAKEARQVVSAAKTDAEHSGQVVKETVAAMGGIESSSKQISNIIGVIDEIAFQTNLLALNAGVEAARAGDAGRGFAVVATEVRALAQRSADAAKEIKTLISASGAQVASGVTLVGETGKALGRMLEQVETLNHLVTDIAASAQEQATGLQEVNNAMNQMDQVTQQNSAMVEEATAASRSLSGEASELAKLVAQFQTGAPAQTYALPKPAHKPAPTLSAAKPRMPALAHVPAAPNGKFVRSTARAAKPPALAVASDEKWDDF